MKTLPNSNDITAALQRFSLPPTGEKSESLDSEEHILNPIFRMCSSMYQLMKELFPAELSPISNTVILFRGANRSIAKDLAMLKRPINSKSSIS